VNEEIQKYCVLDYLYRDAANYKAWGAILLSGNPTDGEVGALRACLESGEYFVAEQVGIPPVYKELWELSGGPNEDDHALHEFVAVRAAKPDELDSMPIFGAWPDLLEKFRQVSQWDYSLSPNYDLMA
jgi:hypothetical protein